MRVNAVIAGVGMTPFGKHLDKSLKWLAGEAALAAVKDAGLELTDVQAVYVGNCAAGLVTGQESIRGQVALRGVGLGRVPIINIENACGSSATALNQACMMVSAGYYDVALAVGFEKLYHPDKAVSYAAFSGAVDIEERDRFIAENSAGQPPGSGARRSMFADFYGVLAREHMAKYGSTLRDFALVTAKNSHHGSLNPNAQFREALTPEEVLAQPVVVDPLTRPMICPLADGGAAVVVVSERKARQMGVAKPVRVASTVLHSYFEHPPGAAENVTSISIREAYEEAGLGPNDLDCVELHDSSAVTELITYEHLGLAKPEDCLKLLRDGETRLGGRIPVNTSGGLLRKGHPVGATGVAQVMELTLQLQGRAGARQVEGARVGLAHNGGGSIGHEVAAMNITILVRG
ncbi:MAG TPA: thiolase family protein [Steroidobacter sp.]|jgi:acetyl-CoA acetyltransferase|nr:thiolase family protein [Steroidobacteraceae bacterium]HLS81224.1 thiolase family protein [Steroidobacter sp.]